VGTEEVDVALPSEHRRLSSKLEDEDVVGAWLGTLSSFKLWVEGLVLAVETLLRCRLLRPSWEVGSRVAPTTLLGVFPSAKDVSFLLLRTANGFAFIRSSSGSSSVFLYWSQNSRNSAHFILTSFSAGSGPCLLVDDESGDGEEVATTDWMMSMPPARSNRATWSAENRRIG
jgi:hypothetical protein